MSLPADGRPTVLWSSIELTVSRVDPVSTWRLRSARLAAHVGSHGRVADRLVSRHLDVSPPLGLDRELRHRRRVDRRGHRIPGVRSLRHGAASSPRGPWSRPERSSAAGRPASPTVPDRSLLDGGWRIPTSPGPSTAMALEYDGRWHDDPSQRNSRLRPTRAAWSTPDGWWSSGCGSDGAVLDRPSAVVASDRAPLRRDGLARE